MVDSVWGPISLAPHQCGADEPQDGGSQEEERRGGYIYCSLTPHNYSTLGIDSKSSFMCTVGEMDSQITGK